jgi:F-type H+-transporting ATPase subunit epsilon
MADQISIEIVTHEGRKLAASADEVTAPSVEGEFGVLPGHLPLLAAVRTGIVSYRVGGETKKVAIGPGFAEAGSNKLLILSDHFIEREQIDPVLVRKELAEIQSEIGKAETSLDDDAKSQLNGLIRKENWLAVQLELYGDPAPATMRPFEVFGPPPPPPEAETPVGESETQDEGAS